MDSSKKSILQECISHFKERKDWKDIIEITSTSWIYLNPTSMEVLKYIYKTITKEPEFHFESQAIFEKKSKIKLSLKEWRNANSEINKACIFYVKLNLLNKDSFTSELELQNYFQEAGMWKNLAAQRNRNQKILNNYPIKNALNGFHLARFHELDLLNVRNMENRKKLLSLDDFEEGIELFYHENKLRILCEKAARLSHKNTSDLIETEREWINRIPENIKRFPQVELFILSYKMILEQCDMTFHIIEDKLSFQLYKGSISKNYLKYFYEYLLLHSIYQINQENYIYAEKYTNICMLMLKEGFGDKNGYLPAWKFKNIIKSAAKILWVENIDREKVFQKMDNFIIQNKNKLTPENKAITLAYTETYILYLKRDFKKAGLAASRMTLPKDELIKIEILFLQLFIFLENTEVDQFLRLRDNIREMLYNKDKLAKNVVDKRHQTITWISKIQKTPSLEIKIFYKECLIEIRKEENFFGKDWLIDYLKRKI